MKYKRLHTKVNFILKAVVDYNGGMANQDDYIKTALRLPRHLHADATVAAQTAGRSLNAELIHRIGQSSETAYLQRVIDQLGQTLKMERDGQAAYMSHVLVMYGQILRDMEKAVHLAESSGADPKEVQRLRQHCNEARGALDAFVAIMNREIQTTERIKLGT